MGGKDSSSATHGLLKEQPVHETVSFYDLNCSSASGSNRTLYWPGKNWDPLYMMTEFILLIRQTTSNHSLSVSHLPKAGYRLAPFANVRPVGWRLWCHLCVAAFGSLIPALTAEVWRYPPGLSPPQNLLQIQVIATPPKSAHCRQQQ
jgi:hypothetical protein